MTAPRKQQDLKPDRTTRATRRWLAPDGIESLPGFRESLRLLIEEERYSLIDIGLMFGVSRERVRQLRNRYGFARERWNSTGLHARRVWNDTLHRFQPVNRGVLTRDTRRRAVESRRTARARALEQRRADIVATVRTLAISLDRDPTLTEIATAIIGRVAKPYEVGVRLAAAWGSHGAIQRGQTTYEKVFNEIRDPAGIRARGVGGRGHAPRPPATHCRHGHENIPENRYPGGACRPCKRQRQRAYLQRKREAA